MSKLVTKSTLGNAAREQLDQKQELLDYKYETIGTLTIGLEYVDFNDDQLDLFTSYINNILNSWNKDEVNKNFDKAYKLKFNINE